MILAARALLVDARTWIEGGGLVVERGVVRRVLRSRRAVTRAGRARDLGDAVLAPGLVDAHAHLDLGALAGRVGARGGFVAWIGRVLRARAALRPRDVDAGVLAGARELLSGGTTAIGDIDASGASARLARRLAARLVVYREVLDAWDSARTPAALRAAARARRDGARVRHGLSPHAPYTTSRELLAGVRAAARRADLPLAIHWAETREEDAWLERGAGPLAALLPRAPRRRGLELLDEAGLLGGRTALVHGNHPRPGEPELLARRGVTLVHCPGTHAFFARPRFPMERYRAAGVTLALGTDSLASNAALDMRREMALARASFPRLAPADVLDMATAGGARALGLAAGRLSPGAPADVAVFELSSGTREAALEELTAGLPRVRAVFVAGAPATRPSR